MLDYISNSLAHRLPITDHRLQLHDVLNRTQISVFTSLSKQAKGRQFALSTPSPHPQGAFRTAGQELPVVALPGLLHASPVSCGLSVSIAGAD